MLHVNRIITLTWYLLFSRENCHHPLCQVRITNDTHWSDVTCNDIYLGRKDMYILLQLGFSTIFWLGPGNRFSSLMLIFVWRSYVYLKKYMLTNKYIHPLSVTTHYYERRIIRYSRPSRLLSLVSPPETFYFCNNLVHCSFATYFLLCHSIPVPFSLIDLYKPIWKW